MSAAEGAPAGLPAPAELALPPPAFTWCRTGKHHHCPGAIEATSSRHVPRESYLEPLRCSCGCHAGAAIRRRKWAPC